MRLIVDDSQLSGGTTAEQNAFGASRTIKFSFFVSLINFAPVDKYLIVVFESLYVDICASPALVAHCVEPNREQLVYNCLPSFCLLQQRDEVGTVTRNVFARLIACHCRCCWRKTPMTISCTTKTTFSVSFREYVRTARRWPQSADMKASTIALEVKL